MRLTASRRFDKCPTPGQRCSENFPSAETNKMTNAQQMPRGIFLGGDGHTWNLHVLSHKLLKKIFLECYCVARKKANQV